MIFSPDQQNERLKWCFDSTKNGAWGDEPDGDHDVVCLRAADFDGVTGRLNDGSRTIRAVDLTTFAKVSLQPGDLIIEKSGGGEKQLVGRAVLFNGAEPSVCSNFLARARPSAKADSGYLNYLLLAIYNARGTWPHIKQSTGIQNLDMTSYLNTRVSIPPLATQRRIAEFLDGKTAQIDALIEKKRVLLDRLAEKRQALITHAVTKGLNPNAPMKDSGIDWLGDIPEHWKVFQLRRGLKIPLSNGLFKRKAEFGEGALLVNVFDAYRPDLKVDYSTLDRVRCDKREADNYAVIDGDIFFVRSSLKMQGIAVAVIAQDVPEHTVFECHLVRARCRQDRMQPRFLSFLLASATYRSRLTSLAKITTMTTIEQESLHSLHLVVPPIDEQTAIAHFAELELERIDNLTEQVEASIHRLLEYRSALITAAVTGQLDLEAA